MNEPEPQTPEVTFSGADLVKLVAATYLPLCDELEANGALDRTRLADAMELYVDPGEISASGALISALQIVLRRPRPGETEPSGVTHQVVLRMIPGGRSDDGSAI